MRFVLASASPARLATLRRAGVEPEVIVSGVDESAITADSTAELVVALAAAKARAVFANLDRPALVLGCDSLLDLDGTALGKPADVGAAIQRWHQQRGRSGTLYTGHALISPEGRLTSECGATVVHFAEVTDDEVELYCRTGEPVAVAGAFTVDGLGGWFVERIDGDPHNVVGLSLPLLRRMLQPLGLGLPDLGYPAV